ncbi:MAG TPA: tRNA (cytidine(34)-2'-O)-methyltransferase [Magnetospirillaceae bacterium]|nr:tRNA (cytidine(34)-2'-O)-methyltransferase [Magnetospirillaceae bacterium]
MRIALYQPDIPQNTGTILRLAACFGVPVDIIEPAGFPWDDAKLRRAGMDYRELAQVTRHVSWNAFQAGRLPGRLVLLTTRSDRSPYDFAFAPDDVLLFGRESAGVPENVHESCEARLRIPMVAGARSLNVAVAAALVLGESLRQCGGFP